MADVSLLIMAGGRSERMVSPKPFLQMEGKSFIERISEGYSSFGITNIFIVLNDRFIQYLPEKMELSQKIIPNHHPEYGRFYSLQTGLKAMPESDFVFIHNVDNPFVEQSILKEMWIKKEPEGFVVPMYNDKGGHPILISKKIVKHILSTENLVCTLRDIIRNYTRIEIEVDSEKILANINTWQEYEEQVLNLISQYCSD
jgi:molybdenum cofactor cytidylyltransferase